MLVKSIVLRINLASNVVTSCAEPKGIPHAQRRGISYLLYVWDAGNPLVLSVQMLENQKRKGARNNNFHLAKNLYYWNSVFLDSRLWKVNCDLVLHVAERMLMTEQSKKFSFFF